MNSKQGSFEITQSSVNKLVNLGKKNAPQIEDTIQMVLENYENLTKTISPQIESIIHESIEKLQSVNRHQHKILTDHSETFTTINKQVNSVINSTTPAIKRCIQQTIAVYEKYESDPLFASETWENLSDQLDLDFNLENTDDLNNALNDPDLWNQIPEKVNKNQQNRDLFLGLVAGIQGPDWDSMPRETKVTFIAVYLYWIATLIMATNITGPILNFILVATIGFMPVVTPFSHLPKEKPMDQ